MSNSHTYYSLVLFLIIFLASSTIACNARPINVSNKEIAKDLKFSTEIKEKSNVIRISSIPGKVDTSLPNKSEGTENGSSLLEKTVPGDKQTMKATNPVTKFDLKTLGPDTTTQVASSTVSWKLPQKKRGEKQPGFNLDYAPPKTHPPVHN